MQHGLRFDFILKYNNIVLKYKIIVFQQFALNEIDNIDDMPVLEIHKLQCYH